MEKLVKLTPEQEASIPLFRQEWLDLFFKSQDIDKELATKQINWMYKFCNLPEPKVMFMDSPIGCQALINYLNDPKSDIFDISSFESNCYYGNVSDYGWVAMYSMIQSTNHFKDYDWSNFDEFKKLLQSGIYELYTFENVCIVCSKPKVTQNANNRLHNETGPAVVFKDGYEMFFWNGINIPSNWIMDKKSITKEVIVNEKNAERRRCIQEILGNKKFAELLEIEVVDEDKDDCGNIMKLWKTKVADELLGKNIFYYEGICPSTKRDYFICVPEVTNVWGAKAWTFKNEKIQIRHGDVGLLNLTKEFDKPVCES